MSSDKSRKSFLFKAGAAFAAAIALPKWLGRRRSAAAEPQRVAKAFNLRQDPKAVSRENAPLA